MYKEMMVLVFCGFGGIGVEGEICENRAGENSVEAQNCP